MTGAVLQVQQAVFKQLIADPDVSALLPDGRVFDHVPETGAPPYVVVGRTTSSDWSTATEVGETIIVFVHTWSKSRSRSESYRLQDAVKAALHDQDLTLSGYHLANLRFQFAETRRDRMTDHLHGVMRFRAVTETIE